MDPLSELAKGLSEEKFERVVLKRNDGSEAAYRVYAGTVEMKGFGKRKLRLVVSYEEEKFE